VGSDAIMIVGGVFSLCLTCFSVFVLYKLPRKPSWIHVGVLCEGIIAATWNGIGMVWVDPFGFRPWGDIGDINVFLNGMDPIRGISTIVLMFKFAAIAAPASLTRLTFFPYILHFLIFAMSVFFCVYGYVKLFTFVVGWNVFDTQAAYAEYNDTIIYANCALGGLFLLSGILALVKVCDLRPP